MDGISFHVDKGEIFGILGPNGAGKTTAVECLEGLRKRDADKCGSSASTRGPTLTGCTSGSACSCRRPSCRRS